MASAKQVVLEVLETLPDDCSLQEIARTLLTREKVAARERDPEERRLDHLGEALRQARMYLGG